MQFVRALSLLACALVGACGILGGSDVGQRTAEGGASGQTISVDEMDQITKNFADRYVLFLSNACDDIKRTATSVEQRQNAHRLKLAAATAAYDVATGPDPVKQLVDMAILVELHHVVWAEEGQANRYFGVEAGAHLSTALAAAQKEIWGLCGRVMTPYQIEALKVAIQEWRRNHPEVAWVSDVRFDVVAGGHGVTLIGGNLGTLTPASGSVTDSIGNARLLAQRAFYSLKRLPTLLDWQLEAALDSAMTSPQADQLLQGVTRTLDSASGVLARLEQILGPSLEGAGAAIDPRLLEIHRTLTEGKELALAAHDSAVAVHEVLETVQKLREPSPPTEPGRADSRPFDINEYAAAAIQIATAAREANQLIADTSRLDESQLRSQVEQMMDSSARSLAREGRELTDHVAWRAGQLIVLVFVLLLLYTAFAFVLRRRRRR
jgi:hypothetical protein